MKLSERAVRQGISYTTAWRWTKDDAMYARVGSHDQSHDIDRQLARLSRYAGERATGRRLIVVDPSEMRDDLAADTISILTSFCVRIYGRQSARNRAISIERALARQAATS